MDGVERDVVDYDPVEAMREPRTGRVAMPKPMLCNDGIEDGDLVPFDLQKEIN